MSTDKPEARFRFLFNCCNDVAAMRRFYVELLGLPENSFRDTPEFAWLAVNGGGCDLMWFRADARLPVPEAFACQPGWAGGTTEVTSWGISIPEERFEAVWRALVDAGAPMFRPVPEWRQDSYWGLSVRDPMGITVEVYTTPKERPQSTEWPDA